MENNYGQLVIYLINKDKLKNFKTTISLWCTRGEVINKLLNLELEGNILNKKKIYFKSKYFKY